MRRIFSCCLLILICGLLYGCGKDQYDKYSEDTLIIGKNNDIKSVSFYNYDDYGNIHSFEYVDDNRMMDYNYSVKYIAIKRISAKKIGDRIRLVTGFESFLSYAGYNNVSLYINNLSNADEDCENAAFIKVGSNEKVDFKDISGGKVLYVGEPLYIEIKGKIKYITEGVKVENSNFVRTAEGDNYIIFE